MLSVGSGVYALVASGGYSGYGDSLPRHSDHYAYDGSIHSVCSSLLLVRAKSNDLGELHFDPYNYSKLFCALTEYVEPEGAFSVRKPMATVSFLSK